MRRGVCGGQVIRTYSPHCVKTDLASTQTTSHLQCAPALFKLSVCDNVCSSLKVAPCLSYVRGPYRYAGKGFSGFYRCRFKLFTSQFSRVQELVIGLPGVGAGFKSLAGLKACFLASSRWEPILLSRPSPKEARLGCKLNIFLLLLDSLWLAQLLPTSDLLIAFQLLCV